ncbi:unnamed protein product, partial [Closterium sp. NIES-54]
WSPTSDRFKQTFSGGPKPIPPPLSEDQPPIGAPALALRLNERSFRTRNRNEPLCTAAIGQQQQQQQQDVNGGHGSGGNGGGGRQWRRGSDTSELHRHARLQDARVIARCHRAQPGGEEIAGAESSVVEPRGQPRAALVPRGGRHTGRTHPRRHRHQPLSPHPRLALPAPLPHPLHLPRPLPHAHAITPALSAPLAFP